MTHRCRICEKDFEPSASMARTCDWICKICVAAKNRAWREANPEKVKAQNRAYREENPEKVKEQDRAYRATPEGREAHRKADAKYQASPRGKALNRKATAKHRAKYPDRYAAHNALNNALRDGTLERLPCQNCPSTEQAQAHHESYEEELWLVVTWLCRKCHDELHANKRNEQHDVELVLAAR